MLTGFNGINTNIMQTGFGIQQAINADTVANMQNTNALQAQLSNCCCETREAIQGINYNLATSTCALQNTMNNNTRDILDNQNNNTRAILDFLTNDKIATLQAENSDLKRAASQDRQSALIATEMNAQAQRLINAINPAPIPAYQVPKGKVSGISGNVDMDVFYKDYRGTTQKGETKMVKISNCGHDENGRYAGGKAGDQTGTEYQIMSWYSRPWLCVLRFNNTKIAAMIADMATKAAQNNLIGYDQGTAGNSNDRYSFWQHLKASNYDPAQITQHCLKHCHCCTGTAFSQNRKSCLEGTGKRG